MEGRERKRDCSAGPQAKRCFQQSVLRRRARAKHLTASLHYEEGVEFSTTRYFERKTIFTKILLPSIVIVVLFLLLVIVANLLLNLIYKLNLIIGM